ncbi:thioredoxin-related transmembrane protein 2 homolog [Choristoneura fumiferana]|uniref:thioredoxin-related transmembrane protein 2 homolog n=1 Tax=Choristoneura fumiferana TaxID=7141 RepID=UPI003D15D74B
MRIALSDVDLATVHGTKTSKNSSSQTYNRLISSFRYGLPFGALLILSSLVIPEPTYQGPELITYFRGPQTLDEELARHKQTTWLVCLYAAWHPACVNFAPVFAELSASYSLDNLKFGKLDVGRYPEAAAKYRVLDGPTSRQLPTLLLLADGREQARRPQPDHSGKLQKFLFSKDNVRAAFDLDALHQQCKDTLAAAQSSKKTE